MTERKRGAMLEPEVEQPSLSEHEEYVAADDAIIGRVFRWSLLVFAIVGLLIAAIIFLQREEQEKSTIVERGPVEAPAQLVQSDAERRAVDFTDVTASAGIDFVHVSGAVGEKLLPETMGGGCAFLDYDGDGDQDLLFVNSNWWDAPSAEGRPLPTMALYRNDGSGSFENVTAGSGLDVSFYGMGVAVGDYDNDGDPDVFISALGSNRLFRNDGGSFTELTESAGLAGEPQRWSTSSGFFDYDGDGDLDLFVCNYVEWSREIDLELNFTLNGVDRAYGPPLQYKGTHNSLYRNEGDGTFTDVSAEAGIQVTNPATGAPLGKALAVTFVDIDHDGRLDIMVANDTVQNFLFQNLGGGRFKDVGAASQVAFDSMGVATGAMGVDTGDLENNGLLGIAIANFANEHTSLYVQQRDPWQFADVSNAEGIGSPSRLKLSFGLFFFDYDLDGRLDLLQANGHLEDEIAEVQPSQVYRQPAQLFWNCGPGSRACFAAVGEDNMGDLAKPIVGRGAAFADIDGDGDLDVLLTQTGDRPMLLRNDQDLDRHWVRLKLKGTQCNRDAIGATVELTAGGITQRRAVMPTRSYLSQVELPLTFGLGETDKIDSVKITWPDGSVQNIDTIAVDALTIIEQPPAAG